MNATQYEELCRRFVAEKVGISPDVVQSVTITNPKRPDLPAYQHQIDLYWETGNDIASYLHIANAKWRGSGKVDQPDVLLLQQVRQKVAAHKAFIITNAGFTAGAVAAARDDGIALHVVSPTFEASELPNSDRGAIQATLQVLAARGSNAIYSHRIECRGFGFDVDGPPATTAPNPGGGRSVQYENRVMSSPQRATPSGMENRSFGSGGENRGGGPGWNRGGGGSGGWTTKRG